MASTFTVTASDNGSAVSDQASAPDPHSAALPSVSAFFPNPNGQDPYLMAQQQGYLDYYAMSMGMGYGGGIPGAGMGMGMGLGMGIPMMGGMPMGPPLTMPMTMPVGPSTPDWGGNLDFANTVDGTNGGDAIDEEDVAAYAEENYPELDASLLDCPSGGAALAMAEEPTTPIAEEEIETAAGAPQSDEAAEQLEEVFKSKKSKFEQMRGTLAKLLQLLPDNDFVIGSDFIDAVSSLHQLQRKKTSLVAALNDSIAAVLKEESDERPPANLPQVTREQFQSNRPLFSEAMQDALFRYWMRQFFSYSDEDAAPAKSGAEVSSSENRTAADGATPTRDSPPPASEVLPRFPIFAVAALLTQLLHSGRIAGPEPFSIAVAFLNLTGFAKGLTTLAALSFLIVHEKDKARLQSFYVVWRDRFRESVLRQDPSETKGQRKSEPPKFALVHHHIFRRAIYKVNGVPVSVGQAVIVSSDCGEDFGYVRKLFQREDQLPCNVPRCWSETAKEEKKGDKAKGSNTEKPRYLSIIRLATEKAIQAAKAMYAQLPDAWLLPRIQHCLEFTKEGYDDFQLVGAQFQMDKKKLYVFFSKASKGSAHGTSTTETEFPQASLKRVLKRRAFSARIFIHEVSPESVPERVWAVAKKVTANPIVPSKMKGVSNTSKEKSPPPTPTAGLRPIPPQGHHPPMMHGGPSDATMAMMQGAAYLHPMEEGFAGYDYAAEEYWAYQAASLGMGMEGMPMGGPSVQVGTPGNGVNIPYPAGWTMGAAMPMGPGGGSYVGFPSVVVGRQQHH